MKLTLKYIFSLSLLLLISSCADNKESFTYFGGKIIHPKSEYVLLYKRDVVVDTLYLDEEDKFIGKYTDFKEGFYYFKHGPEHQYVYIEPKDSILIRLNTWDFDESLVFSGSGAEKNNILIDYFLESEREEKNHNLFMYYGLESDQFKYKMDSILEKRQQRIDLYISKNKNLSESYINLLNILAKFPIYNRFERYQNHYKYINKGSSFPKIVDGFYSFRKNININNDSLLNLGIYTNYIALRLYNKVYTEGLTNRSPNFVTTLLNTVDKNIKNEKLKNTFLKEMLLNDFSDKSTCSVDDEDFETYFKLSTNTEDKKYVQRLLNDVKKLHEGNKVPEIKVTDYLKTERDLTLLTKNKNSVIYFWNPKYTSNTQLIKRINYLTERFPKINYILIKTNLIDSEHIQGIDIKNQFYIDSTNKANTFLTSKYPRTLLVNNKGIIVNGYANINSNIFNKQVELLQKN